jgi:uncharacterized membrane protein
MDETISAISEQILNPLIYLLFAVAFLVFVWGLVRFIAQGGDPAVRSTARQHMIYGIIGMFIMFSAIALVRLVTGIFDIDTSDSLDEVVR